MPVYRTEANRSTTSLPSRVSPAQLSTFHTPSCSQTPRSFRTRTPKSVSRNRFASADPSMASHSLTSIIDMYNQPIAWDQNASSLRSTGSLYYDYSEDFEPMPSALEFVPTLCPIPQRTGSLHRPMVLRAEEDRSLDEPIHKESLVQETDNLENWNGEDFDSTSPPASGY